MGRHRAHHNLARDCPHMPRTGEHGIVFGQVPAGWQSARWVMELRRLADVCRPYVPARASELEAWAADVEARG